MNRAQARAGRTERPPADHDGAQFRRELIELGGVTNRVFLDPVRGTVLRVLRRGEEIVDTGITAAAARLLEAQGIPAVRLTDDPQPFLIGDCSATSWLWAESHGEVDLPRLASTLRLLHGIDLESAAFLPRRNLPAIIEDRLGKLSARQSGRHDYWRILQAWLARTGPAYADVLTRYPTVVHGDVKPANVILHDGSALLLDLDSISIGPQALDHWRVVLSHRHGALSRTDYRGYCNVLDHDPDLGDAFEEFVRVIRLAFTTLWESRQAAAGGLLGAGECARYEGWWRNGASLDSLQGWSR